MSGRFLRDPVRSRRKIYFVIGGFVLAQILLIVGIAFVCSNIMLHRFNAQQSPQTEATEPVITSRDYLNILLVGQSSRSGATERTADTIVLCTINTREKTVTLTSVLRDTLILKPGVYTTSAGTEKIWSGGTIQDIYHTAYTWDSVGGAMAVLDLTLYNNFGIQVDHNVEINFDAFVKLVDLLGCIELDLTESEVKYMRADDKVWQWPMPGKFLADGNTALAYARMCNAEGDEGSDIKRTERQRNVVNAILKKMKTMDIATLQSILEEILPYITTSMSNSQISDTIALLLPMMDELTIKTGDTCPSAYWHNVRDINKDGKLENVLEFDAAVETKRMRELTLGETP